MKIPNQSVFKDRGKEARFWEKNYRQTRKDGKPIKVKFAKDLSETINIRLDSRTLKLVRNEAREKGLGPTQLIRMWVMERIRGKTHSVGM